MHNDNENTAGRQNGMAQVSAGTDSAIDKVDFWASMIGAWARPVPGYDFEQAGRAAMRRYELHDRDGHAAA